MLAVIKQLVKALLLSNAMRALTIPFALLDPRQKPVRLPQRENVRMCETGALFSAVNHA